MFSVPRRRTNQSCRPAERGAYVTDGTRLFRVIAPADPQLGTEDAVLEDCATLEWRIHTVAELYWIPLSPVRQHTDRIDGHLRMAQAGPAATLPA
jgi:hypothetical protein